MTSINRVLQLITIASILVFVLGFFYSPIGIWTGIILGTWFIGTQKILRGFILFIIIQFILAVCFSWQSSLLHEIQYIENLVPKIIIGSIPLLLYRWTIFHRHNFLSTLSLPLWGVAWVAFLNILIPAVSYDPEMIFLTYWFASIVLLIWNKNFQDNKFKIALYFIIGLCLLLLGNFSEKIDTIIHVHIFTTQPVFVCVCIAGGLMISGGNIILYRIKRFSWSGKQHIVSILRSPYTGEPLSVVTENNLEFLVSQSGERFTFFKGIPDFLKKEQMTGSNKKYNLLYEIIGGFYDDALRVSCGFKGATMDQFHMSYMGALECKKNDRVLETSVGTGLNLNCLPKDLKLFGLDLSKEMLINCNVNLERWKLEAELFIGNAEALPFADNSFDVVFHVGGINFFNDREKAIMEMIRVAKPGSRILIADETEEYVKKTYEQNPITRHFYKSRKEKVSAPIDLVPSEMKEIKFDTLFNGGFYVITFRKPDSD